jgi:hypothetical protein
MDPTPVLRSPPDKRWPSTSPDGAWQAVGELYLPGDEGGLYYTRLIVQAVDGSQEWIVVDEWAALALGYTAPRPLRWSADGRYLYYTNVPVPDGCGLFANGSDLQRVDLSSGEVTELVPSVGMRLALSPDEASLAYVGYGDQGLVLRDIASGLEREVPLEVLGAATSAAAGAMVWSPDGSTLLLTVALQPCFPQQVHTIVRVDVGTLAQETLVEADARLLITVEWLEVKEVRLEDSAGQTWWLDPWTGAVYREK